MKKDSEIKILIGCTEEEKTIVYETHNETPYILAEINIHRITSIIIWRYRLIKSYRKARCNSITYSLKTFRQTVEKTVAKWLASG